MMSETTRDFRERLLKAEQPNLAYKERYEKRVQAMLDKKLTTPMKWAWIGSGILGVGFAVVFGTMAIVVPGEFPIWGRIIFAAGAVFGLAWVGLAGWIVKRGTVNLRTCPTAAAGMAWCVALFAVVLAMLMSGTLPDPVKGVQIVVNGLVFLLLAAVFMIFNRVDQAELKTREKLLEIESRLAEMAEAVAKKR